MPPMQPSRHRRPSRGDPPSSSSESSTSATAASTIQNGFFTVTSSSLSSTAFSFDSSNSSSSSSTTTSSATLSTSSPPSDSATPTSITSLSSSTSSSSSTASSSSSASTSASSVTSTIPTAQSLIVSPTSTFTQSTASPVSPVSPVPLTSSSTISTISSTTTAVTSQSFQVTEVPFPSETDTVPTTTFTISKPATISTISTPTSSVSTSASSKPEALSASSSVGFWSNKAMVAGTFTAVVVVALAVLACLFLCIQKKRRSSRYGGRNFSEKLTDSDSRPYSSSPSEPGSHDFTHEPMDGNSYSAYPMQDPFVAHNPLYSGSASLPEITYSYAQDVNNQYPYYGDETNNVNTASSGTRSTPALPLRTAQNPFEPVQNPFEPQPMVNTRVPGRTLASPNQFDEPALRDSSTYQPSLDSFYGASNGEAL